MTITALAGLALGLASARPDSGSSGTVCAKTASESVSTDKPVYTPGSTVTISGAGFGSVCDVTIHVTRPDGVVETLSATTGPGGQFSADYSTPAPPGVEGDYTVDVLGFAGEELATTTFNDPAGTLDHFVVTASTTTPTAGTGFTVGITAQDSTNATVISFTGSQCITFSGPANSPSGMAPTYPVGGTGCTGTGKSLITFTNGVVTGVPITLFDAQTVSLQAAGGTPSKVGSVSLTVGPGALNSFTLNSSTTTPTAGTAFTVSLTAKDTWLNTQTGYTGTHCFTFTGPHQAPDSTTNPSYPAQGSCSSGYSELSFSSGAVSGVPITLFDAESVMLSAADGTHPAATSNLTVGPGALDSFVLNPSTTIPTAGIAFTVSLTAKDQWANTKTNYTGTQCITFSGPHSSPIPVTAPSYPAKAGCLTTGSSSLSFSSGVDSSVSITLYDAESVTLTATDIPNGSKFGTTGLLTVGPGAFNQFGLTPSTPTPTAGVAFTVSLTAKDTWGNMQPAYTGAQCLTFSGPHNAPDGTPPVYPDTGACSGGSAVTFASGVATGGNAPSITVYDVETVNLTATDNPSGKFGTTSLTVGPGALDHFNLAPSTTTPTAGTGFTVSVTAKDPWGNTKTDYTGAQCFTFSGPHNAPDGTPPTYPAPGACSSGSSVTFVNGAATGVNQAHITLYDAESVTLTATESPSGDIATTDLTVSAGPAFQLAFTQQPSGAAVNEPFGTQPALVVDDQWSNIEAADEATQITLAITSGTGTTGANLACDTNPVTVVDGVATFTGCSIDTIGTGYTVTATSSLSLATEPLISDSFDITERSTSTALSCAPSSVTVGNSTTCTAMVSDTSSGTASTPTGTVDFTASGTGSFGSTSCTLSAGSCQVDYTPSATGSQTITAGYQGDSTHNNSTSSDFGLTITERSTSTAVSCAPSSVTVGASTTCTATVSDTSSGTASTPTGTVDFTASGTGSFGSTSCTLSAGSCHVGYTPSASGSQTVTAAYQGDSTHNGSTSSGFGITIARRSTSTALSCSPSSVTVGNSITCTATVSDTSSGTASPPTGTVDFTTSGTGSFGSTTCTLSAGSCHVGYTPSASGSQTVTAAYQGDSTHNGSTSSGFGVTATSTGSSSGVTLSANPLTVAFLHNITLSGTVASGQSGTSVTILGKNCGATSFTRLTTVTTGSGGTFSLKPAPAMNTGYEATSGTATSTLVSVNVSPLIHLAKVGSHTFSVQLKAAKSFAHKSVLFQKKTKRGWAKVKKVTLRSASTSGTTTTTKAKFKSEIRHGQRLRILLASGQAAACYVKGYSNVVKS